MNYMKKYWYNLLEWNAALILVKLYSVVIYFGCFLVFLSFLSFLIFYFYGNEIITTAIKNIINQITARNINILGTFEAIPRLKYFKFSLI